jgi:hypothetical protein
VDALPDVTDDGEKLTLTPAGAPDALNATACGLPEVVATPIDDVAD